MDFLNKVTGSGNSQGQSVNEQVVQGQGSEQKSSGSGGFLGGIGDKLNSAAGGGKESEKNEDYLDKGTSILGFRHVVIATDANIYSRCRLRPREVHGRRSSR